MADLVGEQYIPTSAALLRDQILSDLRLGALAEGLPEPPIKRGTDNYNIATAQANISIIGLQNQRIQNENSSILDARGKALDKVREEEGLPEAGQAGSTGKIRPTITGGTTIVAGQVLITGSGTRLEVVGTYVGPVDGDEIDVRSIDKGKHTNAKGGEEVRFISPPPNVATNAIVSYSSPLTGGVDAESDERKRRRILNKRQSGPAGSWGHIRELVLNADASIEDCYVYPALGGPSSVKVVPVRAMDPSTNEFTRTCTAGQLLNARKAIFEKLPDGVELVVQASVDQSVDFGLELQIPSASLIEGGGGGWTDPSVWPTLVGADNGRVTIDAVALNGSQITVSANTTTAPVGLNTNIAWWSGVDKKFYTSLVTVATGAAGAWVLTLQTPFRDSNGDPCQNGDFISPAAENIIAYGDAWVELFQTFGPGENSASASVTDRAFRHPRVTVEAPANWADVLTCALSDSHPEITNIEREYASATAATIPASIDTGPSILVPGNFGVYPLT